MVKSERNVFINKKENLFITARRKGKTNLTYINCVEYVHIFRQYKWEEERNYVETFSRANDGSRGAIPPQGPSKVVYHES